VHPSLCVEALVSPSLQPTSFPTYSDKIIPQFLELAPRICEMAQSEMCLSELLHIASFNYEKPSAFSLTRLLLLLPSTCLRDHAKDLNLCSLRSIPPTHFPIVLEHHNAYLRSFEQRRSSLRYTFSKSKDPWNSEKLFRFSPYAARPACCAACMIQLPAEHVAASQ
jgi:hypothetical protein